MKRKIPNNESGFTLVELLITTVILIFILGTMSGIVYSVQSSYRKQQERTDAVNEASAALDMITRLIRMAGNNPNGISGLQAIDPGTAQGGVYQTIRIRSDWHGSTLSSMPDGDISDSLEDVTFFVQNNKLMKQEPSDTSAVEFLDNVNYLQFVYYDTNNVMITDPVSNSASICRIDITIIMGQSNSTPITFTSSAFLRQR